MTPHFLDDFTIMTTEQIQGLFQHLKRKGLKVSYRITDNRQTMLSVKWDRKETKVSLHRLFLDAPKNVIDALACYIERDDRTVSREIKAYIESQRKKLDYSHLVDHSRLETQGRVYDLEAIFKELNQKYFKKKLKVFITWFGKHKNKTRSRLSLGLYYDSLKLIKIHRLLDDRSIPPYVVEFVVYHEMLHAVCPAFIDEKGVHRMHGSEFRRREELFYAYEKASKWIRDHQMNFFLLEGRHGRS